MQNKHENIRGNKYAEVELKQGGPTSSTMKVDNN